MHAKLFGFFIGLIGFVVIHTLPVLPPFLDAAQDALQGSGSSALSPHALAASMQSVLALLVLMVVWWVTDAVPLPATALLPLVALPWFHTVGLHNGQAVEFTLRAVAHHYAHPVIFLFMGGFLLAGAMQKWKLDRRVTLWFLTRGTIANDSRALLLGIMAVTAFLSMWVSNTATAAMMLPLGLGILRLLGAEPRSSRFGTALMLGIAWAASIGGAGTIIGTPPNGIAVGILNTTFADDSSYRTITFLDWMTFGVPFVLVSIPVAWWILLKTNPPEFTTIPGGKDRMLAEQASLGPSSRGEHRSAGVFFLAVLFWVSNPFWSEILPQRLVESLSWVDEYAIGIAAGLILFVVPVELRSWTFVLDWRDSKYVEWGTLLLFGGGIALSDAMFQTGLAALLASSFVGIFGSPGTLGLLILVVILVDFLTEVTSNTAVTSMMVPVIISVALTSGADPVTLSVGAAMAASMAFMLPVATPPNALVYGTGYIPIVSMMRSGFLLDITGWVIVVGILLFVAHGVFGIVGF
ncbi:MAG: DASS family sodium-coupled anion symporter [Ignavibacteriales bacterium]|nr:DASS family sodium-coupled anion symporter [Ignavibacteriales bacterium]